MVMGELPEEAEVLVIGGGVGGYAAAFRAAQLGLDVTLATDETRLGGACLLRGCIPSKALLSVSELIHHAAEAETMGVQFGHPEIDLAKLRNWKDGVVGKLTDGLAQLCKANRVTLAQGRARFLEPDTVRIEGENTGTISFEHAIIATGSRPAALPGISLDDARVMDSTAALDLEDVPETLLVIGGGYVGLELGQVYATLGSRVTLVEMADNILPGTDTDLTRPLARRLGDQFDTVHLGTRITGLEATDGGMTASLKSGSDEFRVTCEKALVAVGRKPQTGDLGLEHTEAEIDDSGFIVVDEQRRTADRRIYAVGDAAGGMLLAHKAMHEGTVAAEAIAGHPAAFDVRAIPAIVYTDPQVAWAGLTEQEAKEQGRAVKTARFPWQASGRARTMGASEGMTKLILEPESGRVLGIAAVGRGAENLIAEGALAIEMGATAEDLALTVHAHPTLSETVGEAADLFLGHPLHVARRSA